MTGPPVVSLRGLGRCYTGPPVVEALAGVDLDVAPGEHVAVVGPSGSGKSTLLNLIGLLDTPTSGTYLFDGVDTATMSERERTRFRGRHVGFMFQAFHLMPHRTVVENVAMPLIYRGLRAGAAREIAAERLESVLLGHRSTALAGQLSGGEMQRAAIARALVGDPALLLCDEPTGNLDSATAASVLDAVDGLVAAGLTVLVITHDPDVAERAHRTVTVRDGRRVG